MLEKDLQALLRCVLFVGKEEGDLLWVVEWERVIGRDEREWAKFSKCVQLTWSSRAWKRKGEEASSQAGRACDVRVFNSRLWGFLIYTRYTRRAVGAPVSSLKCMCGARGHRFNILIS